MSLKRNDVQIDQKEDDDEMIMAINMICRKFMIMFMETGKKCSENKEELVAKQDQLNKEIYEFDMKKNKMTIRETILRKKSR